MRRAAGDGHRPTARVTHLLVTDPSLICTAGCSRTSRTSTSGAANSMMSPYVASPLPPPLVLSHCYSVVLRSACPAVSTCD
jgi:hypothetical protein